MGNLIIKGKGGAGNKLIIQDQAGGAVLTTADSGATFYVNGVSQSYVSFSPGGGNGHRYRDNQGQNNNFLGHTGLAVSGNTFFTMGINSKYMDNCRYVF